MPGHLTLQERVQLVAHTKLGDPLFKCKDGGELLKEDILKLMQKRSIIVMQNSVADTGRFQRPGGSASCSINAYP